jgi:hypothetical protein
MANDTEDQVGYKTPPKASQFQKGRSGNPSGRPRRVTGILELLRKVSKQKVMTNGNNGPKYMSKLEASLTQLVNKAAGGDFKAAKLYTEIVLRFPQPVGQENTKATETRARERLLAILERYEG